MGHVGQQNFVLCLWALWAIVSVSRTHEDLVCLVHRTFDERDRCLAVLALNAADRSASIPV